MANKTARTYLKQVRRFLICNRTDRKRLLGRCKELIDSYQQENAEAEYEGLVSAFGEPEACARELLSVLEESEVEAACEKRRQLRRFAIVAVSVALIVTFLTTAFWCFKYYQEVPIDEEHTIILVSPYETSQEAIDAFLEAKEKEANGK